MCLSLGEKQKKRLGTRGPVISRPPSMINYTTPTFPGPPDESCQDIYREHRQRYHSSFAPNLHSNYSSPHTEHVAHDNSNNGIYNNGYGMQRPAVHQPWRDGPEGINLPAYDRWSSQMSGPSAFDPKGSHRSYGNYPQYPGMDCHGGPVQSQDFSSHGGGGDYYGGGSSGASQGLTSPGGNRDNTMGHSHLQQLYNQMDMTGGHQQQQQQQQQQPQQHGMNPNKGMDMYDHASSVQQNLPMRSPPSGNMGSLEAREEDFQRNIFIEMKRLSTPSASGGYPTSPPYNQQQQQNAYQNLESSNSSSSSGSTSQQLQTLEQHVNSAAAASNHISSGEFSSLLGIGNAGNQMYQGPQQQCMPPHPQHNPSATTGSSPASQHSMHSPVAQSPGGQAPVQSPCGQSPVHPNLQQGPAGSHGVQSPAHSAGHQSHHSSPGQHSIHSPSGGQHSMHSPGGQHSIHSPGQHSIHSPGQQSTHSPGYAGQSPGHHSVHSPAQHPIRSPAHHQPLPSPGGHSHTSISGHSPAAHQQPQQHPMQSPGAGGPQHPLHSPGHQSIHSPGQQHPLHSPGGQHSLPNNTAQNPLQPMGQHPLASPVQSRMMNSVGHRPLTSPLHHPHPSPPQHPLLSPKGNSPSSSLGSGPPSGVHTPSPPQHQMSSTGSLIAQQLSSPVNPYHSVLKSLDSEDEDDEKETNSEKESDVSESDQDTRKSSLAGAAKTYMLIGEPQKKLGSPPGIKGSGVGSQEKEKSIEELLQGFESTPLSSASEGNKGAPQGGMTMDTSSDSDEGTFHKPAPIEKMRVTDSETGGSSRLLDVDPDSANSNNEPPLLDMTGCDDLPVLCDFQVEAGLERSSSNESPSVGQSWKPLKPKAKSPKTQRAPKLKITLPKAPKNFHQLSQSDDTEDDNGTYTTLKKSWKKPSPDGRKKNRLSLKKKKSQLEEDLDMFLPDLDTASPGFNEGSSGERSESDGSTVLPRNSGSSTSFSSAFAAFIASQSPHGSNIEELSKAAEQFNRLTSSKRKERMTSTMPTLESADTAPPLGMDLDEPPPLDAEMIRPPKNATKERKKSLSLKKVRRERMIHFTPRGHYESRGHYENGQWVQGVTVHTMCAPEDSTGAKIRIPKKLVSPKDISRFGKEIVALRKLSPLELKARILAVKEGKLNDKPTTTGGNATGAVPMPKLISSLKPAETASKAESKSKGGYVAELDFSFLENTMDSEVEGMQSDDPHKQLHTPPLVIDPDRGEPNDIVLKDVNLGTTCQRTPDRMRSSYNSPDESDGSSSLEPGMINVQQRGEDCPIGMSEQQDGNLMNLLGGVGTLSPGQTESNMSRGTSSPRVGTGRPRGRPRVKPLVIRPTGRPRGRPKKIKVPLEMSLSVAAPLQGAASHDEISPQGNTAPQTLPQEENHIPQKSFEKSLSEKSSSEKFPSENSSSEKSPSEKSSPTEKIPEYGFLRAALQPAHKDQVISNHDDMNTAATDSSQIPDSAPIELDSQVHHEQDSESITNWEAIKPKKRGRKKRSELGEKKNSKKKKSKLRLGDEEDDFDLYDIGEDGNHVFRPRKRKSIEQMDHYKFRSKRVAVDYSPDAFKHIYTLENSNQLILPPKAEEPAPVVEEEEFEERPKKRGRKKIPRMEKEGEGENIHYIIINKFKGMRELRVQLTRLEFDAMCYRVDSEGNILEAIDDPIMISDISDSESDSDFDFGSLSVKKSPKKGSLTPPRKMTAQRKREKQLMKGYKTRKRRADPTKGKWIASLSLLHEATLNKLEDKVTAYNEHTDDYKLPYMDVMYKLALFSPPASEKGENSPPQPLSPSELPGNNDGVVPDTPKFPSCVELKRQDSTLTTRGLLLSQTSVDTVYDTPCSSVDTSNKSPEVTSVCSSEGEQPPLEAVEAKEDCEKSTGVRMGKEGVLAGNGVPYAVKTAVVRIAQYKDSEHSSSVFNLGRTLPDLGPPVSKSLSPRSTATDSPPCIVFSDRSSVKNSLSESGQPLRLTESTDSEACMSGSEMEGMSAQVAHMSPTAQKQAFSFENIKSKMPPRQFSDTDPESKLSEDGPSKSPRHDLRYENQDINVSGQSCSLVSKSGRVNGKSSSFHEQLYENNFEHINVNSSGPSTVQAAVQPTGKANKKTVLVDGNKKEKDKDLKKDGSCEPPSDGQDGGKASFKKPPPGGDPEGEGGNGPKVMTPVVPPPSHQQLVESLQEYGLGEAKHTEPFCSKPEDVPEKPR